MGRGANRALSKGIGITGNAIGSASARFAFPVDLRPPYRALDASVGQPGIGHMAQQADVAP